MLTVHHLENSRSQRVLWLLEELGVEYEVRRYARDPVTLLAPKELRALHPLGKSPIVADGERVFAESGAILEHLVDRYGGGRLTPARGTPEHDRYRYWMHYAEGSAMPPLLLKLVFERIKRAPVPFFVKPIARGIASKVMRDFVDPQVALHLGFIEAELGEQPWFAGPEFSAADVQMSFPVEAALARAPEPARTPHMQAFVDRIRARPAYRRALERGGPYSLLS